MTIKYDGKTYTVIFMSPARLKATQYASRNLPCRVIGPRYGMFYVIKE
jgi:hypothetical protein